MAWTVGIVLAASVFVVPIVIVQHSDLENCRSTGRAVHCEHPKPTPTPTDPFGIDTDDYDQGYGDGDDDRGYADGGGYDDDGYGDDDGMPDTSDEPDDPYDGSPYGDPAP